MYVLTSINHASVNMGVQLCLQHSDFILDVEVELLGHVVVQVLIFLGTFIHF